MLLHRIIKRLLWKREVARLECRVQVLEWRLNHLIIESGCHQECYASNLRYCTELETTIRNLRFRLSEVGKKERLKIPRLP